MKASADCLNLIKRYEDEPGFLAGKCSRLKAYLCPAGVWTIGWGHTAGVRPGQSLRDAGEADELLDTDVAPVEADLDHILQRGGYPVTQGQWDALVSLCFNLRGGPRVLPQAAPKLWRALMAHDAPAAAHEFLDMDHAGTVELAGLKERRQAEAALFLKAA